MNYSIVVPTLNGGPTWERAASVLSEQQPGPNKVLVIDSGSTDQTAEFAARMGFDLDRIDVADFDHGGTRQRGTEQLKDSKVVVFLTQDAVLSDSKAISRLLEAFDDPEVGAAYGRQTVSSEAPIIEQHARSINYPPQSSVKSLSSIEEMGIRAAFCSNSFAAYRISALLEVGGFPKSALFAEDMMVAARMILAGHKVAYQADAECEHWHNYTIFQEFRRSFDIGVFHNRQKWILDAFGPASGEGARLIISGLKRTWQERPAELPISVMKYLSRSLGYTVGRLESSLPVGLKRKLSMNRGFWSKHD